MRATKYMMVCNNKDYDEIIRYDKDGKLESSSIQFHDIGRNGGELSQKQKDFKVKHELKRK